MRQLALLHFRNTITLSVKLEDALARSHARVPPAIAQMLLVLQVGREFGDPGPQDWEMIETNWAGSGQVRPLGQDVNQTTTITHGSSWLLYLQLPGLEKGMRVCVRARACMRPRARAHTQVFGAGYTDRQTHTRARWFPGLDIQTGIQTHTGFRHLVQMNFISKASSGEGTMGS